MNHSRLHLVVTLLALLSPGSGCGTSTPPLPVETPSPQTEPGTRADTESSRVREFDLVGVVRDLDPDEGVVQIDHEDIPGLMPAMLMPFETDDQRLLDDVMVGDEVEGRLHAEFDASGDLSSLKLIDLIVTRPATPKTLTLDLSGGGVTLREKLPELKPGEPVPDFEVTTMEGQPLRLSDLRGKIVILTFVYTRCPVPDFCPLMDKNFADLSRTIARRPDRADQVRLLSVSFDPEHDTPEVLVEHARQVGAQAPLWTYAVAAHDELRKVAEPLGLSYGLMSNQIVHSLSTAVIAPDGTLVRLEKGNDWAPSDLDRTIRQLQDRLRDNG